MNVTYASGETVDHILEAACDVIAEHGLEKTSLRMIAGRAGIARSLLHYYFRSREDLLIQALQRMAHLILEQEHDDDAEHDRTAQSVRHTVLAARRAFRRLQRNPKWFSFFTAMYAGSVYNAKMSEKMQAFHEEEAEMIRQMILRTMGSENADRLILPVDRIIRLVQTLIIGLTIQRALGSTEDEASAIFDDALFLITGES